MVIDSPRRDFRLLVLGQVTSQLGAHVSAVAVPLLAVLTLGASPLQLGLVTASGTVAFALIGLPAGAWVDSWRLRPLLVGCDLLRCLLLASIPAAAWLDLLTITQLVVVSLLSGAARVFFDIGYQSLLPTVVGQDQVLSGNSAMEAIRATGQVAGPGLGGWLVAIAGAANVVLLQAVTFAVSAGCLAGIATTQTPPPPHEGGLRVQIVEGLSFVRRTPLLAASAVTSAASNFAFALASAASVVFMVDTLRLSPVELGLVFALGSLTALIGAAATPLLARRWGSVRVVWLCVAATGPFTLLGPAAQPGALVGVLVLSMAIGEFGQIVYAITNVSLRQRLCPASILGRVNATMRFLMMGLFPVGAVVGGLLAEFVGLRWTLWLAAVIITVSPIPVFRATRGVRDVTELQPWGMLTAA